MNCMSKPLCSANRYDNDYKILKPDYCKLIILGSATNVLPEAFTTVPSGGQTFVAPKDGVMYAVITPTAVVANPITYQLMINNVVVQTQNDATEDQSVTFDFVVGCGDRVQFLQYSTIAGTQVYVAPTTEVTFAPYCKW